MSDFWLRVGEAVAYVMVALYVIVFLCAAAYVAVWLAGVLLP